MLVKVDVCEWPDEDEDSELVVVVVAVAVVLARVLELPSAAVEVATTVVELPNGTPVTVALPLLAGTPARWTKSVSWPFVSWFAALVGMALRLGG